MSWYLLVYGVFAIVLMSGIRIVPEGGRIVVVRLDRPCHVLGPGLRFILPFIDHARRVDLDSTLPEWRDLSEPEVSQRLLHLARLGILGPSAN